MAATNEALVEMRTHGMIRLNAKKHEVASKSKLPEYLEKVAEDIKDYPKSTIKGRSKKVRGGMDTAYGRKFLSKLIHFLTSKLIHFLTHIVAVRQESAIFFS